MTLTQMEIKPTRESSLRGPPPIPLPRASPGLTGNGSRGPRAPWELPQAEVPQAGQHRTAFEEQVQSTRSGEEKGPSCRRWPSETCGLQPPWSLGPKEESRRLLTPEPGSVAAWASQDRHGRGSQQPEKLKQRRCSVNIMWIHLKIAQMVKFVLYIFHHNKSKFAG